MRTWAIFMVLTATVLAGCLDTGDPAPANGGDATGFMAPETIPAIDAGALLDDLYDFVKEYPERAGNTDDHLGARDWLADRFNQSGLDVWRHEFENGIAQENIAGIDWGVDRENWVIIGGHYDMTTTDCSAECVTRPYSEGAYDDGSGTMMLVHLAEAFSQIDQYYTIAFVAFDGEERGLQGSGAFFEALIDGDHPYGAVSSRAMLNLDMFGLNWPAIDAPIYFDENSPELQAFVEEHRQELGLPDDMIEYTGITLGRSDYAHWMSAGVPTGFFISNFEKWQLPAGIPLVVPQGAYPFWHVEDTYETMEVMAGDAQALEESFQMAVDLASGVTWFLSADPDTVLTGTAD